MTFWEPLTFADGDLRQTPVPPAAATALYQHVPWLPGEEASWRNQEPPLQTHHLLVTPQTHLGPA